jgi:hypothetical protein
MSAQLVMTPINLMMMLFLILVILVPLEQVEILNKLKTFMQGWELLH